MTQSFQCDEKASAGKSGCSETVGQESKVMGKPLQVRGSVMECNPNSTEVVPIQVGKEMSDQSAVVSKKAVGLSDEQPKDTRGQVGVSAKENLVQLEFIGMASLGYVACKETFSGKKEEDVDMFLRRFDQWYKVSRHLQEEKATRLIMLLRGEAANVVDDLDEEECEDYAKVKSCLLEQFKKGKADQLSAKDAIERVEFHKFESFVEFIREIKDLTKIAYPAKRGDAIDEKVFEAAMRILPRKFRKAMRRQNVDDYAGLMTVGMNEEAVQRDQEMGITKSSGQPVYAAREEEEEHVNYADHEQGGAGRWAGEFGQQNMGVPIQQQRVYKLRGFNTANPGKRMGIQKCFACRQPGHFAADCPNQGGYDQYQQQGEFDQQQEPLFDYRRPNPEYQESRACYKCGRVGHLAFQCRGGFGQQDGYGQQVGYGQQQSFGHQENFGQHGNNSGRDTRRCFNCGQTGHLAFQCRSGGSAQQKARSRRLDSEEREDRMLVKLVQKMSTMGVNPMRQQGIPFMGVNPMMMQGGYPFAPITQQPYQQNSFGVMQPPTQQAQQGNNGQMQQINALRQVSGKLLKVPSMESPFRKATPIEKRLAVIPIKVNGVRMWALFDTGATVSLMSRSIADRADIKLHDSSKGIQSFTGEIAEMTKEGFAKVSIGNHSRVVEVIVADGQLGMENSFDLILGLKTIMEFPPMTLDMNRRVLKINDNVGMELDLRTKGELSGDSGRAEMVMANQESHIFGRRPRICYGCRQEGHFIAECPEGPWKRVQQPKGERWFIPCDKCQGKGYVEVDPNRRMTMTLQEWEELGKSIKKDGDGDVRR